ncbi:winged helix-turn-helix transcriptional regulator [Clostridium cochlearium]|uniref:winged helix-turn-helix transcriptional regulator n=1 Tax=Clostridium cochlearium TaxID=1494 RepID=UPI002F261068
MLFFNVFFHTKTPSCLFYIFNLQLYGITHKMLSQQLKDLEENGLVHRKQYNQVPPKVEYSLTKKGMTIIPILDAMCHWGENNMRDQGKHVK